MLRTGRRVGICHRGGSSGGSSFLFWGEVVVDVTSARASALFLVLFGFVTATFAVLFLGERVVFASPTASTTLTLFLFLIERDLFATSPTASLSAFFFRVGILLLSLAFGDPG